MNNRFFFCLLIFFSFSSSAQQNFLFRNEKAPVQARVNDLLNRLTLEEKISLLGYNSKPVSRLNIPAYNWWNEGAFYLKEGSEENVKLLR